MVEILGAVDEKLSEQLPNFRYFFVILLLLLIIKDIYIHAHIE